jgi:tetratricopeptide (TPR) repeat protein
VVEIDTPAALFAAAAGLARQGRLPEAVSTYQRALARSPEQPDAWYNLALLQRRLRQFDAALDSYAQALRRGVSRPEEVHLNRGVIYADCLRQEAPAERELRAALAIDPAYVPALQNLANLHEDLGRRSEALAAYERILELDPCAFEALARYAQLKGLADEALPARLRAAIAHPAALAADRASLGFALARLLESAGHYAQAFAAASAANLASRESAGASARYDRAGYEQLIDALIAAFPRARAAVPRAAADPALQPRPIFICGMFRSGSTLTERLLAGAEQVACGGELEVLPQLVHSTLSPFPAALTGASDAALSGLAARYLAGLAALFPGAGCVTDKWAENFLYIGLIRTLLPAARIVHTTRDALDTCLSVFFLHLDQRLAWALDLMDIGHYYRQYRRLMAHWHSLYGGEILEFNYDQLVRDPRPTAQRLFEFCGLEWNEAALDFSRRPGSVKTASVWQVREALYQRSSGRARPYARELAELAAYLAEG